MRGIRPSRRHCPSAGSWPRPLSPRCRRENFRCERLPRLCGRLTMCPCPQSPWNWRRERMVLAELTNANYQQRAASAIADAVVSVRDRLGAQQ